MTNQILTIIHVVVCLGIVGLVLIQHGKGADAGAAFGSGASGTVFGSGGSASFLTRLTGLLATGFFITSLALAMVAGTYQSGDSVVTGTGERVSTGGASSSDNGGSGASAPGDSGGQGSGAPAPEGAEGGQGSSAPAPDGSGSGKEQSGDGAAPPPSGG